MYVLSKRSPKRPPSGDDSACTSALVREMFPSCDGVALSEAPMNLYAAQKTHGSELNQTTAVMLQQLQSKASIKSKRQWRDRKRVAQGTPLCTQVPLPAGRICSSAFSTIKLRVRASVVRICLQNGRPPHGRGTHNSSEENSQCMI